jgi:hypothetical protein
MHFISKINATRLDESWTHRFQLDFYYGGTRQDFQKYLLDSSKLIDTSISVYDGKTNNFQTIFCCCIYRLYIVFCLFYFFRFWPVYCLFFWFTVSDFSYGASFFMQLLLLMWNCLIVILCEVRNALYRQASNILFSLLLTSYEHEHFVRFVKAWFFSVRLNFYC